MRRQWNLCGTCVAQAIRIVPAELVFNGLRAVLRGEVVGAVVFGEVVGEVVVWRVVDEVVK